MMSQRQTLESAQTLELVGTKAYRAAGTRWRLIGRKSRMIPTTAPQMSLLAPHRGLPLPWRPRQLMGFFQSAQNACSVNRADCTHYAEHVSCRRIYEAHSAGAGTARMSSIKRLQYAMVEQMMSSKQGHLQGTRCTGGLIIVRGERKKAGFTRRLLPRLS